MIAPSSTRRSIAIDPEVVFHAAAHKHVPLLEDHPCEAITTNVLGTRTVVLAAKRTGVERFVFISTDKAVRPINVMGASKCLGEQIVLTETSGDTAFCAVRFGNVLGSRGSVVPTFMRQIAAGGPVTVTDARMTRFFMSVHEAVQLVLQAAALASGGEVFILEMGTPVRILDLAQRMIRFSGRRAGADIEIRVTGVRPGEKLTEELCAPEERPERTVHPSIVRVKPDRVAPELLGAGLHRLEELALRHRNDDAARLLLDLAGGTWDLDLVNLEDDVDDIESTSEHMFPGRMGSKPMGRSTRTLGSHRSTTTRTWASSTW